MESTTGQIIDGGNTNDDYLTGSGRVTLHAATGIDLQGGSNGYDISNSTSGNVIIVEGNNASINALSFDGGNATITAGGNLTLSSAIELDGVDGSETLSISAGNVLTLNADISDTVGGVDNDTNIVLSGTNGIVTNAATRIDAGAGTIQLSSTAGNIQVRELATNGCLCVVHHHRCSGYVDGARYRLGLRQGWILPQLMLWMKQIVISL